MLRSRGPHRVRRGLSYLHGHVLLISRGCKIRPKRSNLKDGNTSRTPISVNLSLNSTSWDE